MMKTPESNELLSVFQTRQSLLLQLKERSDDEVWREFYAIYGRMIFGYALRFRLSHSEAEDVVQEVCVKLFRQILSFDYSPELGHFRGWLKTITKHAVIDYIRRKTRRSDKAEAYREHAEVIGEEKRDKAEELWLREWEKAVMDAALRRVYARVGAQSQRIFHLFVVENKPAGEVGEIVGVEANAVYACKHRLLKLVREEVEILKEEM